MIRLATREDVNDIQDLLHETWKDTYGDYVSQKTLDEVYKNWQSIEFLTKQIQNPNVYFPVLVEHDQIVGLATARTIENVVILFRLYVSPIHQRKGIGKPLLDSVEQHFSGAKKIQLHVEIFNQKGQAFYKKSGFKEMKREQEKVGDETINQILMEREMR